MALKNCVIVLLALSTSLLMGTGICTIYATAALDICIECFCYALRDFMVFYKTILFTFGVILTAITTFGCLAMLWENKKMLDVYAKLLLFLLFILFMTLWLGLWGKGPMQLRGTMLESFKSYDKGDCRMTAAINQMQSKFHCCGIDRPEDWVYLRDDLENIFPSNFSIEPPSSCCNVHKIEKGRVKCVEIFRRGCLAPIRARIWHIFSVITIIGFVIALLTVLGTISTMQWVQYLENESRSRRTRHNFETSPTTRNASPSLVFLYPQDELMTRNVTESSAA